MTACHWRRIYYLNPKLILYSQSIMSIKALVPHCITLCSVIFAGIALRWVTHGHTGYIWLLWISMICDRSDGWIARTLGTTSSHGYYLDALCDAIAFGFVPAYCLMRIMQSHTGIIWRYSIIAAVAHALWGVWRLARFLDTSAQYQHTKQTHYIWLPITVTGFIMPIWIQLIDQFTHPLVIYGVLSIVVLTSWLMISQVRVPKL